MGAFRVVSRRETDMAWFREWLWVLLFVVAVAQAQDAPAEGEAAAEGEADAATRDASAEGDEEAWQYVEFLKTEVNEKVELILQETLYEAREKKGLTVLEETVSKTMEQVMEIRESLLMRIKKLKEISQDLLRFKMLISNEIMRMLMLPDTRGPAPTPKGCEECNVLRNITSKFENLVACADEEEGGDADGVEQEQESGAGPDDAPEVECMPPAMYAMELIGVNEMIDEEIKNLYNRIVTTTEEDERTKLFRKLEDFKSLRDTVDDMITKLMSQSEDDKIKKLVKRSLGRVISQVQTILKECLTGCGPDVECESCAADVLSVAIVKMNYYKTSFNNTDDDEAKKEFVRSDLIKYINDNSNDAREILIKKATDGEIDECDQEKSHIYNKIKGPMWMLVNTTIFSDVSELEVMVDAMVTQLQDLLEEYCDPTTTPITTPDGPNCEWEEYEQTKEYLVKVDEIIQEALFKGNDDSAQMTALLEFVTLQGQYDKRVKKLFEDKLICPDEVKVIKKEYMPQLNKCMAEFMNGKLKFSEMSRLQRISCTKVLRTAMETRKAELLKVELEKSLNEIESQESGSGVKGASEA